MDSSNFLFSNQVSTFSLSKSKHKSNNSNFGQSDNINYNSNYLNNSNRFHLLNSSTTDWRQKPSIFNLPSNPQIYTHSDQKTHTRNADPNPHSHQFFKSQNFNSNWRKKSQSKPLTKNLNFQKKNLKTPIPNLQSSDFPPISYSATKHSSSNLPTQTTPPPQILPYKQALQSNSHLSFNQQTETHSVEDDVCSESSIDWDLEEQIDLIPEYIQTFIDSQFPFQDYYNFFHRGSLKFIDNQLINSSNEATTLQLVFLQQRLNIPCPIDVEQLQFIILGYLKVLFPDPCDSDSCLPDDQDQQ